MVNQANASLLDSVDGDVFDHEVQPELLRAFLSNPANQLVVAVSEGQVVGMASGISYVHKEVRMSRAIIVGVSVMLLATGTALAQTAPSIPSGHQAGEESAVLAALDRYVLAISAKDLRTMAAMQTPDGMTYVARPKEGGGLEIVGRPNSYWVDPARAEGPALRERYWSPTVLVRGPIAVVWAPYEFWQDGKTSHCGVDVFDLVKIDGEWRVSNSMWTVEPDACTELRPADASRLRPEG